MTRTLMPLLAVAALAISCASSSSYPPGTTSPGEVRLITPQQLSLRDHEVLAQFEETAPIGLDGEASARHTIEGRMRSRAAKIDADAVAIVECRRYVDPVDPTKRQDPVLICRGLAIRWPIPGAPLSGS